MSKRLIKGWKKNSLKLEGAPNRETHFWGQREREYSKMRTRAREALRRHHKETTHSRNQMRKAVQLVGQADVDALIKILEEGKPIVVRDRVVRILENYIKNNKIEAKLMQNKEYAEKKVGEILAQLKEAKKK